MQKFTLAIFAILIASSIDWGSANQHWPNLKTTWNLNPFGGFNDQPRTVAQAEAAGWKLASDSCEGKYVKF